MRRRAPISSAPPPWKRAMRAGNYRRALTTSRLLQPGVHPDHTRPMHSVAVFAAPLRTSSASLPSIRTCSSTVAATSGGPAGTRRPRLCIRLSVTQCAARAGAPHRGPRRHPPPHCRRPEDTRGGDPQGRASRAAPHPIYPPASASRPSGASGWPRPARSGEQQASLRDVCPRRPIPHSPGAANAEDLAAAEKANTAAPLMGRLKLSPEKLAQLARARAPPCAHLTLLHPAFTTLRALTCGGSHPSCPEGGTQTPETITHARVSARCPLRVRQRASAPSPRRRSPSAASCPRRRSPTDWSCSRSPVRLPRTRGPASTLQSATSLLSAPRSAAAAPSSQIPLAAQRSCPPDLCPPLRPPPGQPPPLSPPRRPPRHLRVPPRRPAPDRLPRHPQRQRRGWTNPRIHQSETTPLGRIPTGRAPTITHPRRAHPRLPHPTPSQPTGLILKGGKEAARSNAALHRVIQSAIAGDAAAPSGVPAALVGLVTSRSAIADLLRLDDVIDLVIPRGSNALVKSIKARFSAFYHPSVRCVRPSPRPGYPRIRRCEAEVSGVVWGAGPFSCWGGFGVCGC